MQFIFWLANHNLIGQRSLEDVIGILGHQLRALGHGAVWNPANDKLLTGDAGINIVVEGFTPGSIHVMDQAHSQGARFLILATEEPTPRGFNHGTQIEMVKRQEMFPEAAKLCEGVLHLVPGERITQWYGQFAPSAPVELGYASTLVRSGYEDPEYDFGFYGSLSKRRLAILKRLANRVMTQKAVKIVADFATQDDRDREMRRAKVIVQVRKFEAMGLVSSSRCNTALCLGRPVIAEPHELSHPWDEIVRFSKTMDRFYDDALMVRAAWRGIHADQFAKFKEKLSPQVCVGNALEKIGVLTSTRRA